MTIEEFSNSFDTLINSYKYKPEFGEQASLANIVLDEYEKSMFLTQAQDNIIKRYYNRELAYDGKGFDDSSRRQLDYSNLITIASRNKITKGAVETVKYKEIDKVVNTTPFLEDIEDNHTLVCDTIDDYFVLSNNVTIDGGIKTIYQENFNNTFKVQKAADDNLPDITFKVSEGASIRIWVIRQDGTTEDTFTIRGFNGGNQDELQNFSNGLFDIKVGQLDGDSIESEVYIIGNTVPFYIGKIELTQTVKSKTGNYLTADGKVTTEPTEVIKELIEYTEVEEVPLETYSENSTTIDLRDLNCLYIINEKVKTVDGKSFVVVPINYKEYDRIMSKAYGEPLKRQAWRLFGQDTNSLTGNTEIILRSDAAEFKEYKIRYIRRPKPIILVDLSNTENNLTIDGYTKAMSCELNPIIHPDVLQEAVRLALASNGIETREMQAARSNSSQ